LHSSGREDQALQKTAPLNFLHSSGREDQALQKTAPLNFCTPPVVFLAVKKKEAFPEL